MKGAANPKNVTFTPRLPELTTKLSDVMRTSAYFIREWLMLKREPRYGLKSSSITPLAPQSGTGALTVGRPRIKFDVLAGSNVFFMPSGPNKRS